MVRFPIKFTKSLIIFYIPLFVILFSFYIVFSACTSSTGVKKTPQLKVVRTTLAKDVISKGYEGIPIRETTSFNTDDAAVVAHIKYIHLTGKHHLRWEWYSPSGDLYYTTGKYHIQASEGTYIKAGTASHRIGLKDSKAATLPGNWQVKVYLDDAIVSSTSFEIKEVKNFETPIANMNDIDFGNYHALVIGNKDYQFLPSLKASQKDAEAVAEVLQETYGFNVRLMVNATRSEILMTLGLM
ncbi:MAG: caspase family protein, partial [Deltaproteobacteria bacterium]|nr:caspase family protein [Deltaproteobacteria bacterium]